jgi:isopropylmalate/homocitrate/citramalate synthase
MKTISISDITLREFVPSKDYSLSFREKLEIAKALDKLNVDKIELPLIRDKRADMLTNRRLLQA